MKHATAETPELALSVAQLLETEKKKTANKRRQNLSKRFYDKDLHIKPIVKAKDTDDDNLDFRRIKKFSDLPEDLRL